MANIKLSKEKVSLIISLRKKGHSLPEIIKEVGCGYGTARRYTQDLKLSKQALDVINFKQGGSRDRSLKDWGMAEQNARKLLGRISDRDKLLLLIGLYWGEGTKREFNIMNGDPYLLSVFLEGIKVLNVKDSDLIFSLRVFGEKSVKKSINYWSSSLEVNKRRFKIGEVINASDSNRLPHGMCRIRVRKGAKHFKLIMSMIKYISKH